MMISLKKIFRFYIKSSIHVALSVFSFVEVTNFVFQITNNQSVAVFSFMGTIVGYNFVKYFNIVCSQKKQIRIELKLISIFSLISLFALGYFYLKLQVQTQFYAIFLMLTIMFYTLPLFSCKTNARNWPSIKIYFVTFCWIGVILHLPIINAGLDLDLKFLIQAFQYFIFVFDLILVFEIIDLNDDDPKLNTIPQQIGVTKTKILGLVLLFFFYFLEFFKNKPESKILLVNLILVITLSFFIILSHKNRSKYYSAFWVESLPILWFFLLYLLF